MKLMYFFGGFIQAGLECQNESAEIAFYQRAKIGKNLQESRGDGA